MLTFHYIARDPQGQRLEGKMQARSSDAVARQLLSSDLIPIHIKAIQPPVQQAAWLTPLTDPPPQLTDLVLFSHQMYTLLKAEVPITYAIKNLAMSTRNTCLSNALWRIVEELEAGRELGAAMAQHPKIFNHLYLSTVRVGETTGQLEVGFKQLARYLEIEYDNRRRIRAALQYPTLVIAAIVIAMGMINVVVMPTFAGLFSQSALELPLQTQILLNISAFTVHYGYWLLIVAGIVWGCVIAILRTEWGQYHWDYYKLHLPVVGRIIQRATLSRLIHALSMTLAAGIPVLEALNSIANAADNHYMARAIQQMRAHIEHGSSLSQAAQLSGLFTPLVLQMLEVGEQTGELEQLLREVAEFYEREVDYDIKNLSTLLEPVLLIGIGGIVLLLALGVFLPMWDLIHVYQR